MRKWLAILFAIILLAACLYIFRYPVLRSFSSFLIKEDKLQKTEAVFVLSGGGYDRGNEAVKVFKSGYTSLIICTGANPVIELKDLNIDTLEADMTAANIRRQGVPDTAVLEIKEGTSTREEQATIIKYCTDHHYKKVMVLSSKIHTRRVNSVFRKNFEKAGISLIIHGAPSSEYEEDKWWECEQGLIAINNEWVKTFYYWWKY